MENNIRKKLKRKIYKLNYLFNKIFKEKFNKKLDFDWSSKPSRYLIINKIIAKKNYKSYLEIGCYKDENFREIKIAKKVGVDPVSGGTIRDTSDNFFLKNKDFYDIIFIDGLHYYSQVKKDILNSLRFLNSSGVILLHDCIPLKIRDQMIPRSHEHWNGDTWKALVEARTLDHIDTYTILADQGLGIIFYRKNKNKLNLSIKNFKDLSFREYFHNFNSYMNPVNDIDALELFEK